MINLNKTGYIELKWQVLKPNILNRELVSYYDTKIITI